MLTSKQRAYLKSLAMKEDAILNIGKESLTEEFVAACDEALEARELIKLTVLEGKLKKCRLHVFRLALSFLLFEFLDTYITFVLDLAKYL